MANFKLKIVTPEKSIRDQEASEVIVPTSEGDLGILPNHAALMAKVIPGELIIKDGSKSESLAVGEGFLQVNSNIVTILTDLALSSQEIDEKVVEEARKRAEQALEQELSDEEQAETLAILAKSLAQLKIKRKHH